MNLAGKVKQKDVADRGDADLPLEDTVATLTYEDPAVFLALNGDGEEDLGDTEGDLEPVREDEES